MQWAAAAPTTSSNGWRPTPRSGACRPRRSRRSSTRRATPGGRPSRSGNFSPSIWPRWSPGRGPWPRKPRLRRYAYDPDARAERAPAPLAQTRQGPRGIRGGRPAPVARGERPGERVRRGDARDHPPQGRRADPAQRVLVRAARPRDPVALRDRRRGRHHRPPAPARGPARGSPRAGDARPPHRPGAVRMRGAGIHLRLRVGGVPEERHARRRADAHGPGGERAPAAADLLPRHQGRDRARREHHVHHGRRSAGRRGRRAPPGRELRDLRGRAGPCRRPGDHHRGYQVRVRVRLGRDASPDRRGAHPRQLALLARRSVPRGRTAAQLRQAAAPGLPCLGEGLRGLERRGAAAAASGGRGRGHQPALPRGVSPAHGTGPGAGVIRIAPEGRWFILGAWCIVGLLALLALTGRWAWLALWLPVAVWVVAFFRDPERPGPRGADLVIAPADGKVVSVVDVDEPAFFGERATRISIFMNVFDCHVNRYPTDGRVAYRHYAPGRFLNAADEKASLENEQSSVGLTTAHGKVLVRQIAGLIARRIVTDHAVGAEVRQGDRLGMIRFGSRVDLFLPRGTRVLVREGDKARVGVTEVARWS